MPPHKIDSEASVFDSVITTVVERFIHKKSNEAVQCHQTLFSQVGSGGKTRNVGSLLGIKQKSQHWKTASTSKLQHTFFAHVN